MESLNIEGRILTEESGEDYEKALQRNSDVSIQRPKYIVTPATITEIPPILAYAKSQSPPMEVAVKGGGAHSATWATSNGGIVIDLSSLNRVSISEDHQRVSVQGGALWGDVYDACKAVGIEVVGGPLWFVGVGGFTVGGGYGPLSGFHGLAVDNLISARLILADGRVVTTSSNEEPDLFWAIRGGGNQFGIVVEFTFKAHAPMGPYTIGTLVYPGSEVEKLFGIIKYWKRSHSAGERLNIMFARIPPDFAPKIIIIPWLAKNIDSATSLDAFLQGDIKPVVQKVVQVPDMAAVSHSADAQQAVAPRRLRIRGTIVSEFWDEMFLGVWERWCNFTETNADVKGSIVIWDVTLPDKICEVAEDATAMHVRTPHYWVAVQGRCHKPSSDDICSEFVAKTVGFIREANARHSNKDLGFFMNMTRGDEDPVNVFGDNLPRLRALKSKYDPTMLWRKGFPIEPENP